MHRRGEALRTDKSFWSLLRAALDVENGTLQVHVNATKVPCDARVVPEQLYAFSTYLLFVGGARMWIIPRVFFVWGGGPVHDLAKHFRSL